MKSLLVLIVAAVLMVGCGPSVHDAAHSGNIEAVKQYLNAGGNVNWKSDDRYGGTSLHWAAIGGHKEIVELLIAKGADVNAENDVNAKGEGGWTPLFSAAGEGHKDVVELLIENGADVNAKYAGTTPLDNAKYNRETAALLRKHGGKRGSELKAEGK
jgi:ankyrin repeat protein